MNKIRELRKEKGLTMKELADNVGVAESTVCLWENGKRLPDIERLKQVAQFFNVTLDYLLSEREYIGVGENNFFRIDDKNPIPILGNVVAGVPIESQENLEGYIFISYGNNTEYFALRVNGDSMVNVGIKDGSILVVHCQNVAENGDIIVAMVNGEQTVKRFKKYNNNIFLAPENLNYDIIPISQNDNFLVLGKVVEVRTQL